MRRLLVLLLALLVVAIAWFFRPHPSARREGTETRATKPPQQPGSRSIAPSQALSAADYPIAAPLNQPDSNIRHDLEVLRQLFEAWRSNFPRDGNPVGENNEITAAL